MGGWNEFVFASVAFLASHSLPARPAIRARLTRWLGRSAYLAVYSAVSLVLLGWLIIAAGRTPYVALWPWSLALLRALALWSLAHLLVNGDLTHVLLFGTMGAFSLLGILMMEQRARQKIGRDMGAALSISRQ